MTDQPPEDEEDEELREGQEVSIQFSAEVQEVLYPSDGGGRVPLPKIRISVINVDHIFSASVLKEIFKGEKPCTISFSVMNGLMYQIGGEVQILSKDWPGKKAYFVVTEVTNNETSTPDKQYYDVTLRKLSGVN